MNWKDFQARKPHRLLKCPHCGKMDGYSPWSWNTPVSCKACGETIADTGERPARWLPPDWRPRLSRFFKIQFTSFVTVVLAVVVVLFAMGGGDPGVGGAETRDSSEETRYYLSADDRKHYHMPGCSRLKIGVAKGRVSPNDLSRLRYVPCPDCKPPLVERVRDLTFVPASEH